MIYLDISEILCGNSLPKGQGISRIDVRGPGDLGKILDVYFYKIISTNSKLLDKKSYSIVGGERILINVLSVDIDPLDSKHIILNVDKVGDFSNYVLQIYNVVEIDPIFSSMSFTFRPYCKAEFDCKKKSLDLETIPLQHQVVDYNAKDYHSFRQALLDLIPSKAPEWKKITEADFGVTLIELYSYVADRLSYYQDRVANERILDTARNRFSVKSHLELIGYSLDNGCSARTFIYFKTKVDDAELKKGFKIWTFSEQDKNPVVFETDRDCYISRYLNEIEIYYGTGNQCILKKGSTSALFMSKDSSIILSSILRKGDHLAFLQNEKREVVTVAKDPEKVELELDGKKIVMTRVNWLETESLSFDYLLDENLGSFKCVGNVISASHGETVHCKAKVVSSENMNNNKEIITEVDFFDQHTDIDPTLQNISFLPLNEDNLYFTLPKYPLSYVDYYSKNKKIPELTVLVNEKKWVISNDLLTNGPFEEVYSLFVDEEGIATIIFGNGINGLKPKLYDRISINYRTGTGSQGNVGKNVLTHFEKIFNEIVDTVTNPIHASGGRDMESIQDAKVLGPKFIGHQERAITPKDYEVAASEHPLISKTKAEFVWNGSWYTVIVRIDPKESQRRLNRVERQERIHKIKHDVVKILQKKRMTCYDIQISLPHYVPLVLILEICISKDFFANDVKLAVETALTGINQYTNEKGLFHPDNKTFGTAVYISDIYKTIMRIPGVISTSLLDIHKTTDPKQKSLDYISEGVLPVEGNQIVRLDNDRNFPEHGMLSIITRGGKMG